MPDYVANNCDCHANASTSESAPVQAYNYTLTDEARQLALAQTQQRVWKEVGRSSAHRTSLLATLVVAKAGTPTGVGLKHASYARYLAKKKGGCC